VTGGPRAGHGDRVEWWSEIADAPARARAAGDRTTAAEALRHARSGMALAWTGDWHNARQLLAAMARRLPTPRPRGSGPIAVFRAEREAKRIEHLVLSRVAVPIGPGWDCPLRRAPRLAPALDEAFGAPPDRSALMPLREILGALGAHEWSRRGVPVPALGGNIHPRYGVFAPIRGEYVGLVARALEARGSALGLRGGARAFDIGTGTGVLAILLAQAGARVVAVDVDPRATASARENAARFQVADRVEVLEADLFPPGRARLIVANPPWIPEQPHGPLDRAVYDPGGRVLRGVVGGLRDRLADGEAWLVLSDLAERIGLRAQGSVEEMIAAAGLRISTVLSTGAAHPRARSGTGPLAAARAAEIVRLYVLTP
jgi:hypothetical protein